MAIRPPLERLMSVCRQNPDFHPKTLIERVWWTLIGGRWMETTRPLDPACPANFNTPVDLRFLVEPGRLPLCSIRVAARN